MKLDSSKLSSILKFNKIYLDENVESKLCSFIKNTLNTKNVLSFYLLTKLFKLTSFSKTTFSYIERSFTMIAESKDFVELDFIRVVKILRSSELLISSELEVYDSANTWLSYNLTERSKFAKELLLTVRFPLLSDATLNYLLYRSSSFSEITECYELFKKISESKEVVFQDKSSIYYKTRYCNQDMFDILLCGGFDTSRSRKVVGKVRQLDVKIFNAKVLPPMIMNRQYSSAVCVKGEVYIFGGLDENHTWISSVEKYSPFTKTWNKVADIHDERSWYCVCAFMSKVFVIGGHKKSTVTNSCLQFDTRDYSWKEVAGMNEARKRLACAVFEERIVVSGGSDNNFRKFNSVESYDVAADKFTPMPNMIGRRMGHNLVAVKNKLFVIGGNRFGNYEVFDSINNKFVLLQSRISFRCNKALSIGTKIYIFQAYKSFVVSCDVDEDEWSIKSSEATENISCFSCVRVPIY